jgi:outer membrane protein OmpA-like peptidoglycan-associated protein
MRLGDRLLLLPCLLLGLSIPVLADPGDVDGSHDYPDWSRIPGYQISDYDEDNPAEFTFVISRPQAVDANHMETMPVEGHRYVIRYEWGRSDAAPSLLETQRFYERLALADGYSIEKSGAVGNVTETFHFAKDDRQIWVMLNPGMRVYALTIVESRGASSGTLVAKAPPAPAPAPAASVPPPPAPSPAAPPAPDSESASSVTADSLAASLQQEGRVVLPVTFRPGKAELASGSKSVIDQVIALLKANPDMNLTIEGHTDLTGDEDANIELSKDRALAVRSQIVAGHIRSKRLTAVGLGGSVPVADEGTAEGREKNRRIELVVRKDSAGKDTPQTATKSTTSKSTAPKETAKADSEPMEPALNNNGNFHAPAPDGVNYYPKTSSNSSN